MRGENCPIASWTTTRTMVRTIPVSVIIEAAMAPRIARAASGPPMNSSDIRLPSSSATVANDKATPASTHRTGIGQRAIRSSCQMRNGVMAEMSLFP
jgi:hypothetical protein